MPFRLQQRAVALLAASLCFPLFGQPSGRSAGNAATLSDDLAPSDAAALQQALAAYDRGDRQHSAPILLDLARRYQQAAQVQEAAGVALAESGDYARAVPFLERAYHLSPADQETATNFAAALIGAKQPEQAIPVLLSANQGDTGDPQRQLLLAQAEAALHNFHEAAIAFQAAEYSAAKASLSLPAGFRHDWAVALLADHRPAEAAEILRGSGTAPDPANLLLRAEAEEQAGQFTAAVADLKSAAEAEPSEANLYIYGDELLRHLTFPAAVRIFEYAVARYPQSARLHLALGVALFGNGSYAQAAQVLLAQLQRTPDDARVADLLGRSCAAELDRADSNCEALLPFAKAHPGNAPAALYAAIVLAHQPGGAPAEQEAATQLLQAAVHTDPKLAEAWYQLGTLQQTAGDWTGSLVSLQRAVSLRPSYAEAHYRLSRAYAHLARRAEAREEIALQQRYAQEASDDERRRMQEVMTFLVTDN